MLKSNETSENSGVKIAPSILSGDFVHLAEEVRALEQGGADWIHLDVMDGNFVPNITIGPPVVSAIKKIAERPLDVHLMIRDPDRFIEEFAAAGSDILCVHAEACPHLHRTVNAIRSLDIRAGVALNPATSLSVLDYVWEDIDMVLLMTVNPGFGGQSFISSMIPKISAVRRHIDEHDLAIELQVDGGIKADNVHLAAQAGATVIVSGSGIVNSSDYGSTISLMRENARKAAPSWRSAW